jgi:DNA-binding CsgD family transcriptional regulator
VALEERLGVPKALGLGTEEWVEGRLGGYVRLGISERRGAVAELTEEGMTAGAIADVLGVSEKTVDRDRAGTNVPDDPLLVAVAGDPAGTDVPNPEDTELGKKILEMPEARKRVAVGDLTEEGMSSQNSAEVLGIHRATVDRDRAHARLEAEGLADPSDGNRADAHPADGADASSGRWPSRRPTCAELRLGTSFVLQNELCPTEAGQNPNQPRRTSKKKVAGCRGDQSPDAREDTRQRPRGRSRPSP